MSVADGRPVDTLLRLQQAASDAGHSLPRPESGDPGHCALAFAAGGLDLAADLIRFIDVLDCPPVTPVPGTRPWLMGVANVRGRPCSVVDLGLFLGRPTRGVERTGKLLVMHPAELGCALYVSRIFGLRYFTQAEQVDDLAGIERTMLPYVNQVYLQDNCTWNVLSIEKLLSDERFLNVGGGF